MHFIKLFALIRCFPLYVDELREKELLAASGTPSVCVWEWEAVKEREEIQSDGRLQSQNTNPPELTLERRRFVLGTNVAGWPSNLFNTSF